MDNNNLEQLKELREAGRSEEGELVLTYLKAEIEDEFDFDKISDDLPDKEKGQMFEVFRKSRKFINNKIDFLTSQEE